MSDNLPLIPFRIDDEQLYTKEPYDFSRKCKPDFSGIKIGCGKPEINKKTGKININCGDDLGGHIWLCQECKDKFDKEKNGRI